MAEPHILLSREDGLVVVRLNRPDNMNSLSSEMLDIFSDQVAPLANDPATRAILIIGTGRAFCAGADVGALNPDRTESAEDGMRRAHTWLKAIRNANAIVVTAVNGAAAGAGFGLALVGDVVLASTKAFFKPGFTALGVAADYGLAWSLPKAVGAVRASDILFSDRRVQSNEALRIGIVARLLEPDTFEEEAFAFARKMAGASAGALLSKKLLRVGDADGFAALLDAEAVLQSRAFMTQDFKEGVAAFLEKREAKFTGR